MATSEFKFGLGNNYSSFGSYGQPSTPSTGFNLGQSLSKGSLDSVGSIAGADSELNAGDPTFMQSLLGFTDTKSGVHQRGWGGMAIGGLSALSNAYMGMKQYGLAKDQFKESKRQYEQNYAAKKTLTNSQLEDRQRARVASNANAYESVGSYMNRNGIK